MIFGCFYGVLGCFFEFLFFIMFVQLFLFERKNDILFLYKTRKEPKEICKRAA